MRQIRLLAGRFALFALFVSALALACPSASAQSARPKATSPKSSNHWQLHLSVDVLHDSNVLDLSSSDRAQVNDPLRADRQGLESADDWIVGPDLELTWSRNLLKRRATSVTAGWDGALYAANTRLNHHDWSFAVDQELCKKRRATSSRVGMTLRRSPDVTLKRIIDDDESLAQGVVVRADQEYDQDALILDGRVELVKERLALDLDVSRRWRDYIATLNERDGTLDEWQASLVGYPADHWRLRGTYGQGHYDAVGDNLATPLAEDDLTSDRETLGLSARFEWGKKGAKQRVQAGWESETREFAASNPYDFYHYGRSDTLTTWGFSWRRGLPHDLAIEVAIADAGNSSSYAQPPPTANPAEDETGYSTTVIGASVSWRLDLVRSRHRKER